MRTYIAELYFVVPGRIAVEGDNPDEAILKARRGEYEEIDYLLDCAEPDVKDGLRVRHEMSDIDDWIVAEERARERGYYVDDNMDAGELADRLYAVARTVEGIPLRRVAQAHDSFIFSPGFSHRVRFDADERVLRMIENEEGGATEDSR